MLPPCQPLKERERERERECHKRKTISYSLPQIQNENIVSTCHGYLCYSCLTYTHCLGESLISWTGTVVDLFPGKQQQLFFFCKLLLTLTALIPFGIQNSIADPVGSVCFGQFQIPILKGRIQIRIWIWPENTGLNFL